MNTISFNKKSIAPSKVVCIGRNYVEHIKELNNETPAEPVIFIKPNSAISATLNTHLHDEIHYEAEISFLINEGKFSAVGFGLDLTKRKIQSNLKTKGLPWERAKAFDKSAIFSEFVEFTGLVDRLRLELRINNILVQQGCVDLMLYKPLEIVEEVGQYISFFDNDILMTGTPKGVGVISKGDHFIGKIYNGDKLLVTASWDAL